MRSPQAGAQMVDAIRQELNLYAVTVPDSRTLDEWLRENPRRRPAGSTDHVFGIRCLPPNVIRSSLTLNRTSVPLFNSDGEAMDILGPAQGRGQAEMSACNISRCLLHR